MAYLTEQDLTQRIGAAELLRLSDRDGDGQADAGVITGAISEAESTINGYLTGRYSLPITPVPALLTGLAADIALYNLHPWGAPEEMRLRFKDAMATLKQIAAGDLVLSAERVPSVSMPQWGDSGPVLSEPRRKGF
ncbi:DUF1320 domain-containing protein [Thalassospira sp.]|uniref:gp436 family protein n=1 Tax=Thalassospira sp. TaxID=1912094 RepID=UPI000C52EC4E|nr:DUF1320 domain-containing protein [Thalassospira sp.]MBC06355.1 hypothetical protein [Thalassospira sp.]|tara:strand:+ start:5064 stop:5471 length:408 start_codon:yes stop_codon:yes gene_type:complete